MGESEAVSQWSSEVESSKTTAENISHEISDLGHKLDDLVHAIRDLRTARFSGLQDYEVLEKARGLSDLVSRSADSIRNTIHDAANEMYDLRRAVEFYNN